MTHEEEIKSFELKYHQERYKCMENDLALSILKIEQFHIEEQLKYENINKNDEIRELQKQWHILSMENIKMSIEYFKSHEKHHHDMIDEMKRQTQCLERIANILAQKR